MNRMRQSQETLLLSITLEIDFGSDPGLARHAQFFSFFAGSFADSAISKASPINFVCKLLVVSE